MNIKRMRTEIFDREIRKVENKVKVYPLNHYFNDSVIDYEYEGIVVVDWNKFREIKKLILNGKKI